jgi:hypothetical protein
LIRLRVISAEVDELIGAASFFAIYEIREAPGKYEKGNQRKHTEA